MKKGRKIRLKYKKERVLLSDVLPYELPIIMSNRMLYRFCVKNKIRYSQSSNMLYWNSQIDNESFEVLMLLFRHAINNKSTPKSSDGQVKLDSYSTIPFTFHILHKEKEFRALSVIHPAMQIAVTDFYHEYKSLIMHYCSRSGYSLRYPHKVASFFYYKDKLHHILLGTKKDNIELFFNEYENIKTFFSYKKYTQIYRFYDDYRFQRAEKRFIHLHRFDIQKCFDSIYTHTIAWATQGGKDAYKKIFTGRDSESFGGRFDTLMQRLNYNETNGIVIGPEFSRIFAEIILQHIDRTIECILSGAPYNFVNGRDYQLYRYVDDYFLFYNEPSVKEIIIELFHKHLEEYKLKISREKTISYERPFLTNISRAKIRIDSLISNWFKYRSSVIGTGEFEIDDLEDEKDINESIEDNRSNGGFIIDKETVEHLLLEQGYYPLVSRKFNQEYKDAIASAGVEPKDILNYTLSCVFTRLDRELKKFEKRYKYLAFSIFSNQLTENKKSECQLAIEKMTNQLAHFLSEVIDTSFFLFALNCRLNSTLKIMRILNAIIIYLNGKYKLDGIKEINRFSYQIRHLIFGKIHYEITNILSYTKCHNYAQLEILYLLIILKDIEKYNCISSSVLEQYIGFNEETSKFHLNTISSSVLLYYIGNKKCYLSLKDKLYQHFCNKIKNKGSFDFFKDAECTIFALDFVCCPFFEDNQKYNLLELMGLRRSHIKNLIRFARRNKYMFTKWSGINITKELAAKISQEVYS